MAGSKMPTRKMVSDRYRKFPTLRQDIFSEVRNVVNTQDIHVVIPNVCGLDINNQSRFSLSLYDQYPIILENLSLLNAKKLGDNQIIVAYENSNSKSKIIVANMFCNGKKDKITQRIINYGALSACMLHLRAYCKQLTSSDKEHKVQIHSPKIGLGFAGGDWRTISNLIEDIWCYDFGVYIYEPTHN